MKNLSLIIFMFMLFSFTSCDEKSKSSSSDSNSAVGVIEPVVAEEETELVVPPLEDIILVAAKSYDPVFSLDDQIVVEQGGSYLVPMEVKVLFGNAGRGGWLELTVHKSKFCYYGKATHTNLSNGRVFRLKKQKKKANQSCGSSTGDVALHPVVSIEAGKSVKLHVIGGGCSTSYGSCIYTEVEAVLQPFTSNLIY